MADAGKISDFDTRIAYLPNDPAPGCSTAPDTAACASKWWATDDNNLSLHVTWGPDTSMEFTFTGEGVEMYGSTSTAGAVGHASVDSHPEVVVNFASADGQTHTNQLLLNQTGLGAGSHTLTLKYNQASFGQEGNRKFMYIDFFQISSATSSSSSISTPTSTSQPVAISQSTATSQLTTTSQPSTTSSPTVAPTLTTITVSGQTSVIYLTPTPTQSTAQGAAAQMSASGPRLRVILPAAIVGALALLAFAALAFLCARRRRRRRKMDDAFAPIPITQFLVPPRRASSDAGTYVTVASASPKLTAPDRRWGDEPLPAYTPPASSSDVSKILI